MIGYCYFESSFISFILLRLHKKIKFTINDFFSKSDQIRKKLRIWSHLRKKSLTENFFFCAVFITNK